VSWQANLVLPELGTAQPQLAFIIFNVIQEKEKENHKLLQMTF
jgi:hypothetical protein